MYLCSKFTDCVANIISCKMFYKLYLIMSGLTFNFDLTNIIVLRSEPATQAFHAEIMVIFTSGAGARADGRKENCVVTKINNTRVGE